ncbi:Uncharacterised protein [Corynebacterium pilosum]|uniref:Uncharacterized protein n=1 Tax=Corynebacterium pilosum TaxID=35756 RepID=A0A376CL99_9CORY|nr:Uncharacterised protein [Corynebacterium pilosum]
MQAAIVVEELNNSSFSTRVSGATTRDYSDFLEDVREGLGRKEINMEITGVSNQPTPHATCRDSGQELSRKYEREDSTFAQAAE